MKIFLDSNKEGFSIQLDNQNTKAFQVFNYAFDDENPFEEAIKLGENTNLKQQVDSFAGEGFFDNNIKGILADDS